MWSRVKHVRDLSPGTTSSFGLQQVAAFWLDVKPKEPVCGLAPSSKQRKVCASLPRVPKSKRWGSRLTTKRPRWEKNRLRRETVARALVTWFTYQDNVENWGRASEATFVRLLRQDKVLQNLTIVKAELFVSRRGFWQLFHNFKERWSAWLEVMAISCELRPFYSHMPPSSPSLPVGIFFGLVVWQFVDCCVLFPF